MATARTTRRTAEVATSAPLTPDQAQAALLSRYVEQVNPEHMATVKAQGAEAAKTYANTLVDLLRAVGEVGQGWDGRKTVAAAYVTRAGELAGLGNADIATRLSNPRTGETVSSGRVSQYKVTARLILEKGFSPETDGRAFYLLTSKAQNAKEVAAVIRQDESTKADILAAMDGLYDLETGKRREAVTRGPATQTATEQSALVLPRSNAETLQAMAQLVVHLREKTSGKDAEEGGLSAGEWATAAHIGDELTAFLAGHPMAKAGKEVVAQRVAKAEREAKAAAAKAKAQAQTSAE